MALTSDQGGGFLDQMDQAIRNGGANMGGSSFGNTVTDILKTPANLITNTLRGTPSLQDPYIVKHNIDSIDAYNDVARKRAVQQSRYQTKPLAYTVPQVTSGQVFGDPYHLQTYAEPAGLSDAYAQADKHRMDALAGLQSQFSQQQQALKSAYNFGPDKASQIVQDRIIQDLYNQQNAASQGINTAYRQAIGATNSAAGTLHADAHQQQAAISSLYNQAAAATVAQQAGNAKAVGGENAGALGVMATPLNGNQASAASDTRRDGAANASYANQTAELGVQDLRHLAASQGGQAAAQQGDLGRLIAGLVNQSNNSYSQREMERELQERQAYRQAQTSLIDHYMNRGENLTDQGGQLALDLAKTRFADQAQFRNTQLDRQFQDSQQRQGFDANQAMGMINNINQGKAGEAYVHSPAGTSELHQYQQALYHANQIGDEGKRNAAIANLKAGLSPAMLNYLQYGAYASQQAQAPVHPTLGY